MLAAAFIALTLQAAPAPTDLTYGEVYGCNAIARAAYDQLHSGGTTPVTANEIALATNVERVRDLTAAEMERARVRDGLSGASLAGAENAAREGLAEATDEQLLNALVICANVFGVTF